MAASSRLTTEDLNDVLASRQEEQYRAAIADLVRGAMAAFQGAPDHQHRLSAPTQHAVVVLGYLCADLPWARSMVAEIEAFVLLLQTFRLLVRSAYAAPEFSNSRVVLERRISRVLGETVGPLPVSVTHLLG
jgi:hypothetical protein